MNEGKVQKVIPNPFRDIYTKRNEPNLLGWLRLIQALHGMDRGHSTVYIKTRISTQLKFICELGRFVKFTLWLALLFNLFGG